MEKMEAGLGEELNRTSLHDTGVLCPKIEHRAIFRKKVFFIKKFSIILDEFQPDPYLLFKPV
jgi:hypothetical protein